MNDYHTKLNPMYLGKKLDQTYPSPPNNEQTPKRQQHQKIYKKKGHDCRIVDKVVLYQFSKNHQH